MTEWQPIETASTEGILADYILWNGERVFVGWYHEDDGWHDIANQEHNDFAEEPQPTHWMPLPEPPK